MSEPGYVGGSIGAHRVRESFNPSKGNLVDKIKRYTADLIDICEEIKHVEPRLASLAQTAYEEAAMWAVKCATTQAQAKLGTQAQENASRPPPVQATQLKPGPVPGTHPFTDANGPGE